MKSKLLVKLLRRRDALKAVLDEEIFSQATALELAKKLGVINNDIKIVQDTETVTT